MLKRSILAVSCLLILGSAWSAPAAVDPTLVGWWWFNEGGGTVASDSSSYHNNGTLMNGATWGTGRFGKAVQLDGVDDYVEVPHNVSLCPTAGLTVMAWVNAQRNNGPGTEGYQGIIAKGNAPRSYSLYTTTAGNLHFSTGPSGAYTGTTSSSLLPTKEWAHVAVKIEGGQHLYFINGVAAGTGGSGVVLSGTADTSVVYIGRTGEGATRSFQGLIDDARIYNRSLPLAEIQKIMTGADLITGGATNPSPSEGAMDVPQDASTSWTAGPYAVTHDVYLGKTFADVNSASQANPGTALVSPGQTAATYTPATVLDYGQTYYWRVDEVNKPSDNKIFKGNVWSFTVEPYSYPITSVTATASSSQPSMGPEKTIDGSGMTGDLHGVESTTMWMSSGVKPNWIQYEFDATYKLDKLLVWNSNQIIESYIGFGAKDVTVEYSVDGVTWTTLAGVPQFVKAPGMAGYAADNTVDFGGVMAKYVKLTIEKNWAVMATQTGLSEVRFTYIPAQARAPQPASETTGLALSTTLNWRPGREATSHTVYLGTDPNAVANGTTPAQTVTGHSFDASSLSYGTTYYWKVDEIGGAGPYAGNVWSFTTQEFAAIDDFESYNDDDNRIYDAWIDGYTDGLSGSVVGYMDAPFAEHTIVHGGVQSMPMAYDNSAKFYSEANQEFASPQDWTLNGATHLGLWFRGYPAPRPIAVTETAGKMTLTGDGADIWNASDEFVYAYKTLTGNGTMVARVTSTGTGSNTWAKGGVMIRASVNGGSTFVDTVITGGGGNGASFQFRPVADAACGTSADSAAVLTAPYWVKIERIGDNIGGYISANGTAWTPLGVPQTIKMADPVLIGICVTSHAAGEDRTFQFENIATTGNVTGVWQGAQINSPRYNDPAGLYAVVEDSSGKSKVVVHPDPAAAATGTWTRWAIPLSDFTSAGVKTTKVQKLTIGVGDRTKANASGAGMLYLDDIGYGTPAATK